VTLQKMEHALKCDVTETKPGLWTLAGPWARIGLQSFGGGASTLFLVERTFVGQQGWLDQEELARFLNLSLLAPGPNLVALTILIGQKLGGGRGMAVSLVGLLVPSALLTCLLTVGGQAMQQVAVVQAMLAGIAPAIGGLLFVVAIKHSYPLLKQSWEERWSSLLGSLLILGAAVFAVIVWNISIIVILFAAALTGIGFFAGWLPPHDQSSGKEAGR
jgi:chromate transporter